MRLALLAALSVVIMLAGWAVSAPREASAGATPADEPTAFPDASTTGVPDAVALSPTAARRQSVQTAP